MALVKCPECGKQASDKADVCPVCGYPIKSEYAKKQRYTYISNKIEDTKDGIGKTASRIKISVPVLVVTVLLLSLLFYPLVYNPYLPSVKDSKRIDECHNVSMHGISGKYGFFDNTLRWLLLNTSIGQLRVSVRARSNVKNKFGVFVSQDHEYSVVEDPEWECYHPYLIESRSQHDTYYYIQMVEINRRLRRELSIKGL